MEIEKTEIEKINYEDLEGQGKKQENFNFHEAASLLSNYGFNCIRLTDDWNGADFLAYHISGSMTLHIQLKGRIGIGKKYMKSNPYILFPAYLTENNRQRSWFLIKHNDLYELFKQEKNSALESESWLKKDKKGNEVGSYHMRNPTKKMIEIMKNHNYLLGHVEIKPEKKINLSSWRESQT